MAAQGSNTEEEALIMDPQAKQCITTSKVQSAELKWTIQNFGFYCKNEYDGECLKSASFRAPGDRFKKWHVSIYPNLACFEDSSDIDSDEEIDLEYILHSGKISVAVNPSPQFKSNCLLVCSISLLDVQSNKELYTGKTIHKYTSIDDDGVSFDGIHNKKFFKVQDLLLCCKLEYAVETQPKSLDRIFSSASNERDRSEDLTQLFASMSNGDVTFVVGKKEFYAHKIILSARSPVFAAMFQHDMKEAALNRVNIVDVAPDIFQAVLRFIYTDKVDLTSQNSVAFLSVANRYNLGLLKWKSEACLAKHLSVDNCCQLLVQADLHAATNLKKSAVSFIRKHSADLAKTRQWQEMKKLHPNLVLEIVDDLMLSTN